MASDSTDSLLSPHNQRKPAAGLDGKPQRPVFRSSVTSDRLRECERWPPATTTLTLKKSSSGGRRSVFREIGLEDCEIANTTGLSALKSSTASVTDSAQNDTKEKGNSTEKMQQKSWYSKLAKPSRPVVRTSASAPPATFSTLPRVAIIAFLIAIVIPGIRYRGGGDFNGNVPADGVGAGPIGRVELDKKLVGNERRADSATNICTRWSHQSMLFTS